MKLPKIYVSVVIVLLSLISTTASAQGYVPKEIKLFTSEKVFKPGSVQDIAIISSTELMKQNSVFEFGVAREIRNGFISSFDIVSSEVVEAKDQLRLKVKIPNVQKEFATSTYVIFLKAYSKNDPESENFAVTNNFGITPSDNPYIAIRNSNLLLSDESRAELRSGPTIYNPENVSNQQSFATSTFLEITFDSNVDTVLKPVITYSKLRSSVPVPEQVSNDIQIKKGSNYVVIPLTTFSYEPGVYVGKVNFRNNTISSGIDFQFIVAGESVTVGQVTHDAKDTFTFQVFGTPLDLRNPLFSSSSEIHTVETNFMYKGKQIFATSTNVNFSSSSFQIIAPATVKNIDSIKIKVISQTTGKIIFEDEKQIVFSTEQKRNTIYIAYIIFLLVLMLLAYIQHKTKFIITLILFIILILSRQVFAVIWNPNTTPYLTGSANNVYIAEGYSNPIQLFLSEDITAKQYACGENLTFLFQIRYIQCANTFAGVKIGFSTTSQTLANASQQEVTNNTSQNFLESQTLAARSGQHYFYTNTTGFFRYNGDPVRSNVNTLYIALSSTAADNDFFDAGWSTFTLPLSVNSCTACTNDPSVSNVPNFEVGSRKYYFSTSTGKLYFRDDNPSAASPAAVCGVDMCSDTTSDEASFPVNTSWKPMPGTYSTDPNRYACLPINVTCSCNNSRNRTCVNSNTGTTSVNINHSACNLTASCSVTYQDRGLGTVNFIASNPLGTLTYIDPATNQSSASSSVQDILIPSEGITITRKVRDSYDGKSITASCDLDYNTSVTNNSGSPSIIRFYASPKVVSEGSKCRYGWETNNMTSCSIDGVSVPVNMSAGDLYAFEAQSLVNDKNITKTLTCTGQVGTSSVQTKATTTVCFVNPRIREN